MTQGARSEDIRSSLRASGNFTSGRNFYFSSSFLPAFKLSKFKIALNTRK